MDFEHLIVKDDPPHTEIVLNRPERRNALSLELMAELLTALRSAAVLCRQTGLLINDALVVALMQHHGLTRLASHDGDFDRVPGLTRYAPM